MTDIDKDALRDALGDEQAAEVLRRLDEADAPPAPVADSPLQMLSPDPTEPARREVGKAMLDRINAIRGNSGFGSAGDA